jgi:hypothetical protein
MKGMNERLTMIRFLSLILISTCAICADLPQDAQTLVNSEGMQELAAKSEFDAKVAKLRKELIPKLQKAQEAATKKGDLDGAVAIKAKLAELAPTKGDKPLSDRGIRIKDGTATTMWDNASALTMSGNPHVFAFYVNVPEATKQLFLRAKPGYGCERVVLDIEGRSGGSMRKEYEASVSEAKTVFRVDASHSGSSDGFSWGPLQYRTQPTGEWLDIPTEALAPK